MDYIYGIGMAIIIGLLVGILSALCQILEELRKEK
jgi:type III secretory pathway component EscS